MPPTLPLDQRVELLPYFHLGNIGVRPLLAPPLQKNEPRPAVRRLLVALERSPRPVPVDTNRLRREDGFDDIGWQPRQPKRGQEAERHGLSVGQPVVRRRFQRMRERVPEVERLPLSVLVRIANADGRLERGAAADELRLWQLPERLAGQETGL